VPQPYLTAPEEVGVGVRRAVRARGPELGEEPEFAQPVSPADTLAEVTGWLERHLDQQVTVAELAALAHMSPRTFARRFVQETGTTPLRWLTGQRILLAQRLLEETGHGVDQVAARAGFGSAMTLRHHFRAWRGTTPAAYRSTFRTRERRMASGRPARTA
jgi:transcriptional regulator GlxA family with amidase domain